MNNNLKFDSIYTVGCQTQLNSFDRKVITALYQPIIGHDAMALYFTLWSEVEIDRVYTSPAYFKRLIKVMNIDLECLSSCFNILEGLGLVKTLYYQDKNQTIYHFKILSPEQPSTFFKNPLLTSNLKNALDQDDYNRTKLFFNIKEISEEKYTDISKKYQDVFSMNYDFRRVASEEKFKEYKYAKIENEVDFDLIKDALRPYNLNYVVSDPKVQKTIEMLLLTYPITINDLVESIIECSDDYKVDLNELNRIVEMKEKIKKHKTDLELVYLRNNEATNKYEKNSVFDFLKKYCKSLKVEKDLLINLEQVIKEYKLDYGVLNVLIEYVVSKSGFINFNYLKAIAKGWQHDGINNVESALKKVNDINSNDQTTKYKNKEVIGSTESWYQIKDNDEMSEEDANKIDDILKRLEKR